ncbi:MAG: CDP-alcohol phosphatidyltransferase family protein [Deltaproteobacteria bacterium]|nr:CDP-alcohol phosphatidyltransferase family protein [Deltaproteobacteria bacterium]
MRDAYFTYAHAAFWALVIAFYAVRVALRGAWRSERVAKIGGTALVGRGVMDMAYWVLDPIVKALVRLRITPNQLTWSSLVLASVAAVAAAYGWFGLACLSLTWAMFFDILDGQVARATGVGSMKGEVLDSAIDRYCEMIYFVGFALFVRDVAWQLVIVLAAAVASLMVSYAGVMADAMKVTVARGLMRRHERALYLILGTGLVPLVGPALHDRWDVPVIATALAGCAIIGLLGNLAAVVKFVRIARALP